MSCDVVWTVELLTELKKAYASGVQEVSYNDKTLKYRSLNEMRQLIKEMEAKLCGDTQLGSRRFFKLYAKHSKGLC